MASIERRQGKRGVRYEVRYRVSGKERSKSFQTRREAEQYRAKVLVDVSRGAWVDPRAGRITLTAYAKRWFNERATLRPRTRETYEAQFRLHIEPKLGPIELSKLTPADIRTWHASLVKSDLAANTAAKVYRLLRTMLGTACSDELIARNPCVLSRAGLERADERPVATAAQVWQLADAMPEHLRCVVLLSGFVGLRLGEVLGLERRHVNALHGTLRIEQQEMQLKDGTLLVGPPKTDAGKRTPALPAFLVKELDTHLEKRVAAEPDARLFPGQRGGPLRRHVVQKHWNRARQKVELPDGFRFHDLRHTANTLTASSGASTRELMYRMGHASPAAALRYQHATQERDSALAEALGDLVEDARTNVARIDRKASAG